jgi:hypothetical protein
MISVNSLSGGRTSGYLAMNYPADINIFALVCNEDPNCGVLDPFLRKYVNEKLENYSHFGEFIGTPEDIKTIGVMYDLEQLLGKEIIWVRDESFESMCKRLKAIPNQQMRFCTSLLKMKPIFEYVYPRFGFVEMRVGYRYDELERAERFTTDFKYVKHKQYQEKSNRWINRYDSVKWRNGSFPMIKDGIFRPNVIKFWNNFPHVDFPEDSNCQMCFWKNVQVLRKNFESNPHTRAVMQWAKNLEIKMGRRFRHNMSLSKIEEMGLQLDFIFADDNMGCQSGFCTN